MTETLPPAGWYPDPTGAPGTRWWDGAAWSGHVRPVSVPAPAGYPGYAGHPGYATPRPTAVARAQPAGPAPVVYTYPYASAVPLPQRPLVRGMGDAIRVVFARYAQFEGLASRPEFWYWYLFNALVGIGLFMVMLIPIAGALAGLAWFGWAIAVLVPTLAVAVRRLRDAGYHWAWMFLALVPFGGIALLVLWCQRSRRP